LAPPPIPIGTGFSPASNGKDDASTAAQNKSINDAVASIRALATLRGRNADWAEKAVREGATLTATDAHKHGVIEIIANDVGDLLALADGRVVKVDGRDVGLETSGLTVQTLEPDWRTRVLAVITNPNIAYVLLLIGMYGLLFEFLSPGALYPGVLGGISLLTGLYALNLLPVNYAGVALLLLGVALMTAEAFLPSFGALGIGGVPAFAVGSLLLLPRDVPGMTISWPVVGAATAASAGFLVIALAAAWWAAAPNSWLPSSAGHYQPSTPGDECNAAGPR
jgi:membrane-bound serine protease (ClpP class)